MKGRFILLLSVVVVLFATGQEQRVSASLTTQGFAGLKARYERGLAPGILAGVFYHGSALMLAQGDVDTGELGLSIAATMPLGNLYVEGLAEAGYRYQNQNLGFAQTAFASGLVRTSVRFGIMKLGVELGLEQALVSGIVYSDFVRETFRGMYEGSPPAPDGSLAYFPSFRLKAGLAYSLGFANGLALHFGGGLLYTPTPFVAGFEGMAFGFFPFYADMGFCLTL